MLNIRWSILFGGESFSLTARKWLWASSSPVLFLPLKQHQLLQGQDYKAVMCPFFSSSPSFFFFPLSPSFSLSLPTPLSVWSTGKHRLETEEETWFWKNTYRLIIQGPPTAKHWKDCLQAWPNRAHITTLLLWVISPMYQRRNQASETPSDLSCITKLVSGKKLNLTQVSWPKQSCSF